MQNGRVDTIASFLGKLEVIKSSLVNMGDDSITDASLIAKVLANLPPSRYSSFLSARDNVEDASRTLNNLTIRLLRHENRLRNEEREDDKVAMAYAAAMKHGSTSTARFDSQQSQANRPSLTYEQRQERRREINERKKVTMCWGCNQLGHWARECPLNDSQRGPVDLLEDSKNSQQPPLHRAYMTTGSGADSSSWYMDSGCTDHMTNVNTYFSVYTDISRLSHIDVLFNSPMQEAVSTSNWTISRSSTAAIDNIVRIESNFTTGEKVSR